MKQSTEPKHGGSGVVTESSATETVYCGACRCGWKSPVLRYVEMVALGDYADHIEEILKEAGDKRDVPKSASVNQNPKRECLGSCGDTWPDSELCIRCGKCFYCCTHPEPERDRPAKPRGEA